ncbi:MAG: hypothetical protein KC441_06820 [Anaerolineales bacterium]|nr:hypothetical protein [Anaerolineales bacterium]
MPIAITLVVSITSAIATSFFTCLNSASLLDNGRAEEAPLLVIARAFR